ncbi:MAG: redoxin domain-containing protein, partial [Chloroflexota bacterium]
STAISMVLTPTPAPMMTFVPPLVAPTNVARELAPYPVYGPAAELRSDIWLNTDTPLRLADLRGQVVLLMFWAFNCPPCLPVLPYVSGWDEMYGEHGLTVLGIHTPKIDTERDYDSLVEALDVLGVLYPVAQDNEGLTWQSYGQEVWPTIYLIDRRGYLRYQHIGLGGYPATEAAIQALLAEDR